MKATIGTVIRATMRSEDLIPVFIELLDQLDTNNKFENVVFPFELMGKYFRDYCSSLGINYDIFLQLGVSPDEPQSGFNMTAFSLRIAGYRNAVSQKHAEVARDMWKNLWPGEDPKKIPIDYVTNGVHVPTWIEPKMELLFNKYLEPDWLEEHDNHYIWEMVDEIPDQELWDTHVWLKIKLIDAIREKARKRWTEEKLNASLLVSGGTLLDPTILTIGFARRFATYKRATLLFSDLDRLKKILLNPWRPVQIIFAGKAHPADQFGRELIQQIYQFAKDHHLGGHIAFVEDYDMHVAKFLVQGVDVWLNNPRPPLEASGTSGQKAALNGVPNLSVLDGWWKEGYDGSNGWAVPLLDEPEDDGKQDVWDCANLYSLLENEVIPLYYKRGIDGIPHEWCAIVKNAIRTGAPRFSARRMLKEYVERAYAPLLSHAMSSAEEKLA